MELYIRFYERTMVDYFDDDVSPLFPIHWVHRGSVFPFDDWWDYGADILDSWLRLVQQLAVDPQTSPKLKFIHGPYELQLRREGCKVEAWSRDPEVAWSTTMGELCQALCAAGSKILDKFVSLELRPDQQKSLRQGIRELERARSWLPD